MGSIMVFFLGALVIAGISWRTFSNPRSHGFFRFLAFEAMWALIMMNARAWFQDVLSFKQIFSWILLIASFVLAVHAFYVFIKHGKPARRAGNRSPNFAVEETTALVTTGIYGSIRHPMYTSLMLLTWGAAFKTLGFWTILMALIATGLLFVTARAEEFENLEKFGEKYDSYMSRTKMFLPRIY